MTDTRAAPSGHKPSFFGFDPWTLAYVVIPILAITPLLTFFLGPNLIRGIGRVLGWYLRKKTDGRRSQLLEMKEEDERAFQKERSRNKDNSDGGWETIESYTVGSSGNGEEGQEEWAGVVGFFHPFCHAGGGGERVLWAAIRATQQRWPKALCVVYTGDHEANKKAILDRVMDRFNIELHPPTVVFLYLSKRNLVEAATWPHFTLLGQSLGSMVLAWDALQLLVPDVFIDTMGYAFALGTSKWLFRDVPTCAYVHYPTISTDMLESLDPNSALGKRGVNAGRGVGLKGWAKKWYWQLFAIIYSWMGSTVGIVMTNSSWTQGHIESLWGPYRAKMDPVAVVYPPCPVRELEQEVEVSQTSEQKREKIILYIAQFRPEKDHELILQSFAEFLKTESEASKGSRLVLVGSVRGGLDSRRVYKLRLLVNELGIKDRVEFHTDAPWPEILQWLRRASVGVNGMWNEHFGIGVVEYQAAGLICVVHGSGGPKLDIVTEVNGEPTGFLATSSTEFAEAFEKALSLPNPLAIRTRARLSATRFTEEEFARRWTAQMARLVAMSP